jgi:hypothetical protein
MVKKIWELTDTLKCVINCREILKQRVAINPCRFNIYYTLYVADRGDLLKTGMKCQRKFDGRGPLQ